MARKKHFDMSPPLDWGSFSHTPLIARDSDDTQRPRPETTLGIGLSIWPPPSIRLGAQRVVVSMPVLRNSSKALLEMSFEEALIDAPTEYTNVQFELREVALTVNDFTRNFRLYVEVLPEPFSSDDSALKTILSFLEHSYWRNKCASRYPRYMDM